MLYLILFGAVFHRFWDHAIIYRDSFHLFAPLKYYVREGWRSLRIDAWHPWQYLGMPFAGNVEAGWFYPLNIIYALLPFEPAHRLFILIHYPLAALGMDLLLRRLGTSPGAALFGGLAFALSGYMISMHSLFTMLIGPAWAPLAVYCFLRARDDGLIWAAAAGAVIALQVLGGDPQNALITGAVLTVICGGELLVGGERRRRALPALGLAGASSLLLSAVQVLPTLELARHSMRSHGLSYAQSAVFSLHPAQLFDFIWPTPWGVNWPEDSFWGRFILDFPDTINVPWAMSNYLGPAVIVLAGFGLLAGPGRRRAWIAGGAAVFLLLALGRYTPAHKIFFRLVPLADWFRYPAKYTAWLTGFVVVAAAGGWDELARRLGARPAGAKKVAWLYGLAAMAGGLVFVFVLWPGVIGMMTRGDPGPALAHLRSTGAGWLIVNAGLAASLWLAATGRLSARRAGGLGLILLVMDWSLASVAIMPSGPTDLYASPSEAARAIAGDGGPALGRYRIYREAMSFPEGSAGHEGEPTQVRTRYWERDTLGVNLDTMLGFEDLVGFNSARPSEGLWALQRGLDRLEEDRDPGLLGVYNLEYIVGPDRGAAAGPADSDLVWSDRGLDVSVWRVRSALPRAYWMRSAAGARDDQEAQQRLTEVDLRRRVIITGLAEDDAEGGPEGDFIPARVTVYEPDRVVIESEADGPGWLVLNDRYFPGWTARVDGRAVPIFAANVFVRAVRVAGGRHTVEFTYRPWSLTVGLAVSAAAGAALAGWILWRRRTAPRPGPR